MNKKIFGFVLGGTILFSGVRVYALNLTGNVAVRATTSVQSQNTGNSSGSVIVGSGNGDLHVQVQAGTIATSSASAIVSLQGNSVALIQSSADLTAYSTLVSKVRPAITIVNIQSDNSIDIGYSQPAKFLGVFSTALSGDVNVDAQGNTTVHMPWYAFLYTEDTTKVQASVVTAVEQSGVQFGAQANATAKLQDDARVINAVSGAIQAQVAASASVNASAH